MSENDDKLQKLLRLKNYESPGEEYFDNFLDEFKDRQRRDAMQQSPFELIKERVSLWFDDLGPQKWAVPAGSMAALAVALFTWGGRDRPISDNDPVFNYSDPSKTEPHIFGVQLPKKQAGPNAPAASTESDSVLPANFEGLREL